jgi:hypothetical protein
MLHAEWTSCAASAPLSAAASAADVSVDGLLSSAPCASAFHESLGRYLGAMRGLLSLTIGGVSLDAAYNLPVRFKCPFIQAWQPE